MPDRLTLGATLVVVAVALGLAFGAAVLAGEGRRPRSRSPSEHRRSFGTRRGLPSTWA